MCRNIKPLYHLDPPADEAEIRAAALQFVRKVSGFTKPSQANQAVFDHAVDEIAQSVQALLNALTTTAPARDRATQAAQARRRSALRFGPRADRATRPDDTARPA